jgi:hypothetical protein
MLRLFVKNVIFYELIECGIVNAECFKAREKLGDSEREIKATPILQSVIDYLEY